MDLNHIVADFLNKQGLDGRPVLLAYSGGSDSTALYHALLEYKPLNLHLVHVDHGWRKESREEALALQQKALVPFHLLQIEAKGEMESREKRYQQIKLLYDQLDAQALILAHQGEDCIETLLKKLFEGAHFLALHGMKKSSFNYGMQLWRPLLEVPKQKIADYLAQHDLTYIQDPANRDPRFLRPRFRMQLLPDLEKGFGKAIKENLIKFSTHMEEIEGYFDRKIEPYLKDLYIGKLGAYYDFNPLQGIEPLELSALLKRVFQRLGVALSHEQMTLVQNSLLEKRANITIGHNLFVDRGILFWLDPATESMTVEAEIVQGEEEPSLIPHWHSLLSGELKVTLPLGDYQIGWPNLGLSYCLGGSLKKWFADHKTPSRFRLLFPCVLFNGIVVHEFLTGKKSYPMAEGKSCTIKLSLLTTSFEPKKREGEHKHFALKLSSLL